ncbi:MAG: H4MPT-linked C1 transfer pathway protein [Methanospirillum sp.]|nr:H4MPT-linked C1 transfer pathway protein [Methanospirillum sp.]
MLGIDIGGANLKVVDEGGAHIHYCPLWKEAPIREILKMYSADRDAAVVMSGELADCFSSKYEGIGYIVSAVRDIFPKAQFYGIDGVFHQEAVPELAAANWLVMADVLRGRYPDALLVDMGSTTTDIIPLNAFGEMKGQTDYSRLGSDLLLYYGLLRTPVSSLLREVMLDAGSVRVSSEYFACAGDAHLVAGVITPDEYTTATPDNTGPSREECLRRLARVVCADLSEIGTSQAEKIARQYIAEETGEISRAVRKVQSEYCCPGILTAGIGSRFLRQLVGGEDLRVLMGDLSDAMPAWAVREAALRTA